MLRPPGEVMRLSRLGRFHPTRLSFARTLIRRMAREGWRIETALRDLDEEGYGASPTSCTRRPGCSVSPRSPTISTPRTGPTGHRRALGRELRPHPGAPDTGRSRTPRGQRAAAGGGALRGGGDRAQPRQSERAALRRRGRRPRGRPPAFAGRDRPRRLPDANDRRLRQREVRARGLPSRSVGGGSSPCPSRRRCSPCTSPGTSASSWRTTWRRGAGAVPGGDPRPAAARGRSGSGTRPVSGWLRSSSTARNSSGAGSGCARSPSRG